MTLTSTSQLDRAHDGAMSEPDDTDPAPRPRRRTFTAEYKHRMLDEYDGLPKGGSERGALLRREGLYSSHISEWRNQRERAGDRPAKHPRRSAGQVELDKLRARNDKLTAELQRTRLALEITGKAHALLELLSESADTERRSTK
jgi:transposase